MANIQNILGFQPILCFTEFDILEKYRNSFNETGLSRKDKGTER